MLLWVIHNFDRNNNDAIFEQIFIFSYDRSWILQPYYVYICQMNLIIFFEIT